MPVILFVAFIGLAATPADYTLINSVPFSESVYFTTDKLGNAYAVVENQVLKYDPSGNPLSNFSENNLGQLTQVDASDPLKPMLFYPDFARMIVLDSKLAMQSSINLRDISIFQPVVVCTSEEDGYWIYDREDDQLKKISQNLQVVRESGSLLQAIGFQVNPNFMLEKNGYLYLNDPEEGILLFDRYGTYYKTLPYTGLKTFQVIEKDILFVSGSKMMRYDAKALIENEVLIPRVDSLRAARIEQHQLYLLTSESLNFYSF